MWNPRYVEKCHACKGSDLLGDCEYCEGHGHKRWYGKVPGRKASLSFYLDIVSEDKNVQEEVCEKFLEEVKSCLKEHLNFPDEVELSGDSVRWFFDGQTIESEDL